MFRGGSLWSGVVSGGLSQLQHTYAYRKGKLKGADYAVHTAENVTGSIGLIAGIECGAVLGTALMPGIGTFAGSFIGAAFGHRLGSRLGFQTGTKLFRRKR